MPGDDAMHGTNNDVGVPGNPTGLHLVGGDQHQGAAEWRPCRQQLQRARP
jgi:hypothetical protein